GYFLDVELNRDALARYGISVKQAESVVATAIGGEPLTTTIEGRERYGVSVRYPRELRDDPARLARVLVATSSGAQVPLSQIATIKLTEGASMIRDENGLLAGYVFVDIAGRDIGSWVEEAKRSVAHRVALPAGYTLVWSGQYENLARVKERLKLVIPLTLFLIVILLYF